MRPLKILNQMGSMRNISVAGSILAPVIDNRFVPYPYLMIWVVTRRCNARCQMCSIWHEKDSPFLAPEQIESAFAKNDLSFVRSLTLTGGEPTLRNDLPELFMIALRHMPNLELAALATSGLNTRRTIDYVGEMLETLHSKPNKIYRFDVQISLDGVGEVHDQVRGIDGFFDNVQKTISGLHKLQERYPKLNLKFSSVLMPQNLPHVQELQEFAKSEALPIFFSPVVMSGEYYNNLHGLIDLKFSAKEHQQMAHDFFSELGDKDQTVYRYYYQDMAEMVQGAKRRRRCMMGYLGFVMEHTGNIYPCVNCEGKTFGNLLSQSFEEIWFGAKSENVRTELRQFCCPTCTSMCFPPPANAAEVVDLAIRKLGKGMQTSGD